MLDFKTENCLSAVSLQSASLSPIIPSGRRDSLNMEQRVNIALSYVSRKNPVAVSLMQAMYVGDSDSIKSATRKLFSWVRHSIYRDKIEQAFGDDCTPFHINQLCKLAVVEIVNLSGSTRCDCLKVLTDNVTLSHKIWHSPNCEKCSGSGFANNEFLSERQCVTVLNDPALPSPIVTRYAWRNKLKPIHREMVAELLQLIAEASSALSRQVSGSRQ